MADPWVQAFEDAEAGAIALSRGAAHDGHRTPRMFDNPHEEDYVGACGEKAFAMAAGLPLDRDVRPNGDGGIDFVVRIQGRELTIDVKTNRRVDHLLVKTTDHPADIYVLAHFDRGAISFVGWE